MENLDWRNPELKSDAFEEVCRSIGTFGDVGTFAAFKTNDVPFIYCGLRLSRSLMFTNIYCGLRLSRSLIFT